VHQEEVELLEAELLQSLLERTPQVVGAVIGVAQFAGNVQLFARDPGRCDRLPDTLFVPVTLRGIDVTVAEFESETDDRCCSFDVRGR